MFDTILAEPLKTRRVRVLLTGDHEVTGILKGVTSEKLWINEDGYAVTSVVSIAPAPLFCSACGTSVNRLTDDMCASCYRISARDKSAPVMSCENCGKPGAVRNPRTRRMEFLCVTCHAGTGEGLLVHPGAPVVADCTTEDVTSDKHEWGHVRGIRFRCVRCRRAEKFDSDLLAELRRR